MNKPNWPKCPKCKKRKVRIKELWMDHAIDWEPDSGESEGILNPGDPYRVEGECLDCGNKWKLRGVSQVESKWWEEA